MPYKNLMAPQVAKKFEEKNQTSRKLHKYPGRSIFKVNYVFRIRPICPVSGTSFQRYLPNVSPNNTPQKMQSLHGDICKEVGSCTRSRKVLDGDLCTPFDPAPLGPEVHEAQGEELVFIQAFIRAGLKRTIRTK